MNPDDITTETIMPEAFLDLAREMVAQKSPEAAARAALAWALRHRPVNAGALEVAGHRIERIAPEPDPWPTAPLIVADWSEGNGNESGRSVLYIDAAGDYCPTIDDEVGIVRGTRDTLTNVVPVTVVPTAEWEAMATTVRSLTAPGTKGSLLNQAQALVKAADALGVDL